MRILIISVIAIAAVLKTQAQILEAKEQPAIAPSAAEVNAPFSEDDEKNFMTPPMLYHPETWFHFIGGNVSKQGITADLEAIAGAGLSGIQLFHGQFGGPWPGVEQQITCLSPLWDEHIRYAAEECRRLGLRFTMQNCPGWSMAGGPWITPDKAQRNLVMSRTDLTAAPKQTKQKETNKTKENQEKTTLLPRPQPSNDDWRDYQDLFVLAFPTPEGDEEEPLQPLSAKGDVNSIGWDSLLTGKSHTVVKLPSVNGDMKHWVEVKFPENVIVRTIEFPAVGKMQYDWCYDPNITASVEAVMPDGKAVEVMNVKFPPTNWQDNSPVSLSLNETSGASVYRIYLTNSQEFSVSSLRFFTAARKNNWEGEAAWTLREINRTNEHPKQSAATYINPSQIIDLTELMDSDGTLHWQAPEGKWTVLRFGHVNPGYKNAPAPREGTGFECDKLSEQGAEAHFPAYIGRIANGPLAGGLLKGMLLDSWECYSQTWTHDMEQQFRQRTGYELRKWLPAVFGYVESDQETTSRFLRDWRGVISKMQSDRFYGKMAQLAHQNGLAVQYETATGDVFPGDFLEYWKHADITMTEFWQPLGTSSVGSINFKPVRPAASAARMYGKPRVAAEAFTSFALTWDEHLEMLKEVANVNSADGVSHLVFHTYTHNPLVGGLPPSTSFAASIGTPFLRLQTWWRVMPAFTDYLSRLNYLFERGKPVSDVLWYIGDELDHKPNQRAPFPAGYKYDYCNPDVLLNRLTVSDGKVVTPEGISYRLIWIPENERMLPETLEKLLEFARQGVPIVGNAPVSLATLSGGAEAQRRFDAAVKALWGGGLVMQTSINEALKKLNIEPDFIVYKPAEQNPLSVKIEGATTPNAKNEVNDKIAEIRMYNGLTDAPLWLHRKADNADWYFVSAPYGSGFEGEVSFNNTGEAELWNPVTGEITPAGCVVKDGRATLALDLRRTEAFFIVFRNNNLTTENQQKPKETNKNKQTETNKNQKKQKETLQTIETAWTLTFPSGWGITEPFTLNELKAWKDLPLSDEGKAFSGTATYKTVFDIRKLKKGERFQLDLGEVEMAAEVSLNGVKLRTLWTHPYILDITEVVRNGKNELTIEVTGTWFNRLVYDASQPETARKTWTLYGPEKDSPLRVSGLLGPVTLKRQ